MDGRKKKALDSSIEKPIGHCREYRGENGEYMVKRLTCRGSVGRERDTHSELGVNLVVVDITSNVGDLGIIVVLLRRHGGSKGKLPPSTGGKASGSDPGRSGDAAPVTNSSSTSQRRGAPSGDRDLAGNCSEASIDGRHDVLLLFLNFSVVPFKSPGTPSSWSIWRMDYLVYA